MNREPKPTARDYLAFCLMQAFLDGASTTYTRLTGNPLFAEEDSDAELDVRRSVQEANLGCAAEILRILRSKWGVKS